MDKFQFKTNIKCGGCVAKVTPHLNALQGVKSWKVNIQNPDKILTFIADGANAPKLRKPSPRQGLKQSKDICP